MDHQKDIESTLNALLLNASEPQQQLLDTLFSQWNALSDDEKQVLFAAKIETKMHELAKKNQACLRKIGSQPFVQQTGNSSCSF